MCLKYFFSSSVFSIHDIKYKMGFPGGSAVKNLLAVQEMQKTLVLSQSWVDPLEEEMATHSNSLAWKIPWTERHLTG